MRHELTPYWSIDVPSEFRSHWSDDGFLIFDKPGMRLLATVYIHQPFDSAKAVREYLEPYSVPEELQIPFVTNLRGTAGCGFRYTDAATHHFHSAIAAFGQMVNLSFQFDDAAEFDATLAIWRTLEHTAPDWVWLFSNEAEPALGKLCEAILSSRFTADAVEEVEAAGQVDRAFEILVEVLQVGGEESANACFVIELLGRAPESLVHAVTKLLADPASEIRRSAHAALATLAESGGEKSGPPT